MVDPANREDHERPQPSQARVARARTAGERTRGSGSSKRQTSRTTGRGGMRTRSSSSSTSSRASRRRYPAPVSSRPGAPRGGGGSARILAPLALAVFALACVGVISNSGSSNDSTVPTQKSAAGKAAGTAAGGTAAATTRKTYRVKAGDSFAAIAEKLNIDVNQLQALNPDVDPRALQPGQKLKLR